MKFTARQLLLSLVEDDKDLHASFKVNKYDRDYQVWKREPLSIELPNKKMFIQKLEYIHYNLPTGRQVLYGQGYVKYRKIIIILQRDFILMAQTILEC